MEKYLKWGDNIQAIHVFVADKKSGEIHWCLFRGNVDSDECMEFIDELGEYFFGNSNFYWATYDHGINRNKCEENFREYVQYRMIAG